MPLALQYLVWKALASTLSPKLAEVGGRNVNHLQYDTWPRSVVNIETCHITKSIGLETLEDGRKGSSS